MAHRDGATGIVVITQLDPIFVVFVAPGDRFGEIRDALKDDIADVEALSTGSRRVLARGTLTLMDDIIDAQNGSVKLGATFDNKNVRLWPGLPSDAFDCCGPQWRLNSRSGHSDAESMASSLSARTTRPRDGP
jgi:hypothetical protein